MCHCVKLNGAAAVAVALAALDGVRRQMVERLGHVLYWAGCVLAILIIVIGVYLSWYERDAWEMRVITFVVAALVWLIGRACRYLLAGT
jgi:hypothetical protein